MNREVRLSEVCQIQPPKSEVRSRLKGTDSVTFAPMETLGIGRKSLESTTERHLADVAGSYTYFAENDVLLAKITPCFENGKLGIASNLTNGVGFGSSEYIVFRPSEQLLSDYLYYFLSQKSFRAVGERNMTGAAGQKRITRTYVESCLIPVPRLNQQERIVAILDEAFEGIARAQANAEKSLEDSRALFSSYLDHLKGPKRALASLVAIKTGKLDANAAVNGGIYPFFTCSREVYAINTFAFDCHAILLAGNNAVGDFNVKIYNGKFNAYQRTYVITIPDEKQLSHRYLYYQILKSMKEFKQKSVGAGTKFLKIGMIESLEIVLPPIDKQQSIVDSLDRLFQDTQRLEGVIRQKQSSIEELRQSLLQDAFSGNL